MSSLHRSDSYSVARVCGAVYMNNVHGINGLCDFLEATHTHTHTNAPKCFFVSASFCLPWIQTRPLRVRSYTSKTVRRLFGWCSRCARPLQDYLDAMVGVCYDGVEGVLYLCLFSVLAACAFTVMLCAIPRAWRQIACRSVCSLPVCPPERPHFLVLHEPTHA